MVEEGRDTHADGSQPASPGGTVQLEQLRSTSVVLKDLLHFLAQNLVTRPNAVEVTESPGEDSSWVLALRVDKEDLGRVIGKRGAVLEAIQSASWLYGPYSGTQGRCGSC